MSDNTAQSVKEKDPVVTRAFDAGGVGVGRGPADGGGNEQHERNAPPRRILRRIGAVFAGLLAGAILSIGTDIALHASGVFPPLGQPMADSQGLI